MSNAKYQSWEQAAEDLGITMEALEAKVAAGVAPKYPCPVCEGQMKVTSSAGSGDMMGNHLISEVQVHDCAQCRGTGREHYKLQDYRGWPIEYLDRERYERFKAIQGSIGEELNRSPRLADDIQRGAFDLQLARQDPR